MGQVAHTHNTEQHGRILTTALLGLKGGEELYVNHHNGDKQLNRRIKINNDNWVKIIAQVEDHAVDTQNIDESYAEGQEAIRTLRLMKEKKEKFWDTTIGKVFGIAGTVIATLLTSYIISLIK